MTAEEAHAFFARRAAAYVSRDVQTLAAGYAEDCVVESPSGTTVGRAAVEEYYRRFFAVVSDLALEVGDLIVMGDQVVITGTVNGTGTAIPGLESGKRFSLAFVSLFTMRDRQIVRLRRVDMQAQGLRQSQRLCRAGRLAVISSITSMGQIKASALRWATWPAKDRPQHS